MNSVEDLHNLGNLSEDFVYKKDLKRKLPEDAIKLTSPKRSKIIHSLDYQAYKDRVLTFTDPAWCCYSFISSSCLLPQQLARYGWSAKEDKDTPRFVQCVSCKAILYLKLPPVTSPVFNDMVAKQEKRVSSAHAEFCPWSSSPSPISWTSPLSDTVELIESAASLLHYNTDLPWINIETIDTFKSGVGVIVEALNKRTDLDKFEMKIKQIASILSLLGWRKGKLDETLSDNFSVRRVGLWNFVSIQNEMDRVEDLRVARELSGDVDEAEISPKKNDLEGKKYFDPIKEHLTWNPINLKNEDGSYGWELIRDSFETSEKDENEHKNENENDRVEAETEEFVVPQAPAQGVLSKVRALLDLW